MLILFFSGAKVVRVELGDGEEVIEKDVSDLGRIGGLKKWAGRRAKIIFLTDKKGEQK